MLKAKIWGAPWLRHSKDSSSGGYSCNKFIEWSDSGYDFEVFVDSAIPQGANSSFQNKIAWILESRQVIPNIIIML